jgi:hypothetical protein
VSKRRGVVTFVGCVGVQEGVKLKMVLEEYDVKKARYAANTHGIVFLLYYPYVLL